MIKKILVPTDLIKSNKSALECAISLANQFDAKIYLLHVYQIQEQSQLFLSIAHVIQQDIEVALLKDAESMSKKMSTPANISIQSIKGQVEKEILEYADLIEADLILMGMQSKSKLEKMFLGSTTTSIIKKTNLPVLVVPENISFLSPKSIAFALDSNIVTTSDVVEPMLEFAKAYNSKIEIIHVGKPKVTAMVDAGVDIYLSEVNHKFNLIEDKDSLAGIEKFVDQKNTDLLCMIHRQRGTIGNLFHKSITREEVFNCKVPLLVLQDGKE